MLFEQKYFVQDKILRLYYQPSITTEDCHQFAFVVAKKKFAKATDRNRIKRLMREAVRLQKNELHTNNYLQFVVQYRANEILAINDLMQSVQQLFLLLNNKES